MRLKFDWFVALLLLMIVLGRFIPGPGLKTGIFSLKTFAEVGISAIFLLYGISLNLSTLWKGMVHWRLHATIQLTTFVFFPVLMLAIKFFIPSGIYSDLWLSIFFLAVLPSTVSSAVVMVSLAGGNVSAAVFNATLSSVAGIFITPLWMSLFIVQDSTAAGNSEISLKLTYQILLPLFLGLLLNKKFHSTVKRLGKFTRYFDQTVILAVVYTSFSASYHSGIFNNMGTGTIFVVILSLMLLFSLVNGFVWMMARVFNLPLPDLVAALFCGSTKSLMHGSAMSKVIFASAAQAGFMLIPVLIYHSMQLIISGVMVQRFARKLREESTG